MGSSTPLSDALPHGRRRFFKHVTGAFVLLALSLYVSGCTYSGGELLYMLGVGKGQKVEAKFRLTHGPLLILIDDASHSGDVSGATRHLFENLSQELLKQKGAQKIIPQETLVHLRQSLPDFEKRGCREIGKQAGAEQVLWIEIQDFVADEQIQDALTAASFAVTVKVIDVREDAGRSHVRLWPETPAGHAVAVSLTGSEVAMAKTRDAILKEVTSRLAVDIAKLFYDHRLGDFERQK